MVTTNAKQKAPPTQQKICIDLPGEQVQCWRSSDNIQVILRKHRDVVFDINFQTGATYTVESKADFYCPALKKLLRKVEVFDGVPCHVWVGRDFKEQLVLQSNGRVLGSYRPNQLDTTSYGTDPKTKPEPLMVIMGKKESTFPLTCTPGDPFGLGSAQTAVMSNYEPTLSVLKNIGTKFDYTFLHQSPDLREYVAITEAVPTDIQPKMLAQLRKDGFIEGKPSQIFLPPKDKQHSIVYAAMATAAGFISGSQFLTSNFLKKALAILQSILEI